ncbi:MAG: hypothetical protein HYZ53_04750 [Planctomycetes bacterium]|nr:hypothetical protein [Planctomycetota bacterium]
MLARRMATSGALFAAALLLGGAVPVAAEDAKGPTHVTVGVKGLDGKEQQGALEAALKGNEAVEAVRAEAGKVTVQVRAEKTLKLSAVADAVKGASNDKKPLSVETDAVALAGGCSIMLSGTGDAKDDAILKALQSVPNVDKASGTGGTYALTFKGAKGASIGDVVAALKKGLGVKEGGEMPGVSDVWWTAPKAEPPKKPAGGGKG